jgi:N-methylhydantoinase B
VLEPGDVVIAVEPGGAGVGDPLRRRARDVARDVAAGLVSAELAEQAYGVIMVDGAADEQRTDAERATRRSARIHDGVRSRTDAPQGPMEGGETLHPVGDAVDAVEVAGRRLLRCTICREQLSAYEEDFKPACVMRELSLADGMPANADCDPQYALREYCCPGCGTALAVDVQGRAEPIMPELSLGSAPPADPS